MVGGVRVRVFPAISCKRVRGLKSNIAVYDDWCLPVLAAGWRRVFGWRCFGFESCKASGMLLLLSIGWFAAWCFPGGRERPLQA